MATVTAVSAFPVTRDGVAQSEDVSLAEVGNAFSVDLYRRLAAEPGNLFVSPVSLSIAFGLAIAAVGVALLLLERTAAKASAMGAPAQPGDDDH